MTFSRTLSRGLSRAFSSRESLVSADDRDTPSRPPFIGGVSVCVSRCETLTGQNHGKR